MMVLAERPVGLPEDSYVSSHVMEVIERHVSDFDGPPTSELVEAICDELASPSQRVQAVYYFLIESPLRLQMLPKVCRTIDGNILRNIGTQAKYRRDERQYNDRRPRWTE